MLPMQIFATRCYVNAAYVVMQCLSVCLSRSYILPKLINVSSNFFHHRVANVVFGCGRPAVVDSIVAGIIVADMVTSQKWLSENKEGSHSLFSVSGFWFWMLRMFEILFLGQWSIICVKFFNWGPSSLADPITSDRKFRSGVVYRCFVKSKTHVPPKALGNIPVGLVLAKFVHIPPVSYGGP